MKTERTTSSPTVGRNGGRAAAVMVAITMVLAASSSANAQTNVDCTTLSGNWCLRLSEKEDKLEYGDDPVMAGTIESDVGSNRNNFYRSMPSLALTNMSPAGGPDLLKFEMTIGDTRFHFEDDVLGTLAMLGAHTPGYNLTSSVSSDGNKLTVNFAKGSGGVAPGETVHFQIDLGLDKGITGEPFYEFPDFRTVLFDKNAQQYYGQDPGVPVGAEDNSQVTVHFSNGVSSGPKVLPDFTVTEPQNGYVNENWHPFFAVDGVDQFGVSGAAGVVPEPSSVGLVMLGLFGGLTFRARTRLGS